MRQGIQIPCKPGTLNGFSDRPMVRHDEDNDGSAIRTLDANRRMRASRSPPAAWARGAGNSSVFLTYARRQCRFRNQVATDPRRARSMPRPCAVASAAVTPKGDLACATH